LISGFAIARLGEPGHAGLLMSQPSLPTVLLKPGDADRVVAGHPWIYKGSILRVTRPPEDGDVVQVKDHRQRFLGVGFFNSRSKIHVRLLSRERAELDEAFFRERMAEALAHRKRFLPGATSFRLVNAEGDFLSGLIVDCYGDIAVVQITSLGMEQRKAAIVRALARVVAPRVILERSDTPSRKMEGLEPRVGVLQGEDPGEMRAVLNGLDFDLPSLGGHKTGLYLDQQVNYRDVAAIAAQAGVQQALDAFCFQGAFALHLARAGVPRVLAVDQCEEAVRQAHANAARNGLGEATQFEVANVFDWFKQRTARGPSEKLIQPFDMIVLDPPSFTRNKASVPDALRGYKEIHLRALKLLRRGGLLATFCCSHHVDAVLFGEVILSAAYDARRTLRRIAIYSQSPDHPVVPAIPESEYLKGFLFEVAN